MPPRPHANPVCSLEGCDGPTYARTWCKQHYFRWHNSGSPHPRRVPTVEERFWAKVDTSALSGCWQWTGSLIWHGYGHFSITRKKATGAHRYAYELLVGPIPDGLEIDHLCRNRGCVNPLHLEAVTATTNKLRGTAPPALNAVKSHCKRGHEFTPENTGHGRGESRFCLTCKALAQRERNRAQRAERDAHTAFEPFEQVAV